MSINQPKVIVHRSQPSLDVVIEVFAVAHDERRLIEDARQAVKELDQQGIFSYSIILDPKADEYVGDLFGRQYAVIDRIERLPERLPQLFMALTK